MKKYKIDLHLHSILSHDGGLSESDFKYIFDNNILDYLAITDHNEIDFALKMQDKFKDKIIVGEEIKTKDGEIIALYLNSKIEKGLSIRETIIKIREQNALCFLPHPYSKRRSGIGEKKLLEIYKLVDFIEGYNGRSFFSKSNKLSLNFAKANNINYSYNSDSHSIYGIGNTYTIINDVPNRENLLKLLRNAEYVSNRINIREIFAPSINRIKKLINNS